MLLESKKGKNYGIEVLRILCMLMVCTLHIFGGVSSKIAIPGTVTYWLIEILRIFCLCAVNCYALISGYVCVYSKNRIQGIVKLWFTVVFYTVSIFLIFSIFANRKFSINDLIAVFMPVSSIQYWYFSAYTALFFNFHRSFDGSCVFRWTKRKYYGRIH